MHHDVRQRTHLISTINIHSRQICGLKWSPSGQYLASGSIDMLQLWSIIGRSVSFYTFKHRMAVKTLAWCPWQNNILASGGDDETIRFWNMNTGVCLKALHTESQIGALLWSENYKEIASGHGYGYGKNQITIWKYPSMIKITELMRHKKRISNLIMSPDKKTILSASPDETIMLWKCFDGKSDVQKSGNPQSILNIYNLII